jgi:hypothetical protein
LIQFYALSVVLNICGGYALAADTSVVHGSAFDGVRAYFRDSTVRLVLGILTLITGCFKLLAVIRGDIPIVGDFLPAAGGIAVGLALLLERHRGRAEDGVPGTGGEGHGPDHAGTGKAAAGKRFSMTIETAQDLFLSNKKVLGIAGMIAGLIHFLFPMVLFL